MQFRLNTIAYRMGVGRGSIDPMFNTFSLGGDIIMVIKA